MLSSAKGAPQNLLKFQAIQVSEMKIQPDTGISFNFFFIGSYQTN